jgi:hypothetical protein
MTKETMIWQTLEMIIAGMVARKEIPAKEDFEQTIITKARGILDYSEEDIRQVLYGTDYLGADCLEFAKVMNDIWGVADKNNVT